MDIKRAMDELDRIDRALYFNDPNKDDDKEYLEQLDVLIHLLEEYKKNVEEVK